MEITGRPHFTSTRVSIFQKNQKTSIGEALEKLKLLCIAGRNVKCCNCFGKQFGGFSKKLNIKLPHDSAIPLLSTYTKKELKIDTQTNTHSGTFTAALFTRVKRQKPNG